jgi:hypothetical protein
VNSGKRTGNSPEKIERRLAARFDDGNVGSDWTMTFEIGTVVDACGSEQSLRVGSETMELSCVDPRTRSDSAGCTAALASAPIGRCRCHWIALSNVRDQRRRAVGAPLADRNLSSPAPVPASGVPTRDDRCIA